MDLSKRPFSIPKIYRLPTTEKSIKTMINFVASYPRTLICLVSIVAHFNAYMHLLLQDFSFTPLVTPLQPQSCSPRAALYAQQDAR
jgi:hypothetical protein